MGGAKTISDAQSCWNRCLWTSLVSVGFLSTALNVDMTLSCNFCVGQQIKLLSVLWNKVHFMYELFLALTSHVFVALPS